MFRIYSAHSEYVGQCKFASDAAVMVSRQGDGATVRVGPRGNRAPIWTEGQPGETGDGYAADDLDHCEQRLLKLAADSDLELAAEQA